MSPERRDADDPQEWLNRARSNLIRAGQHVPGVLLEDLCFDAQQAAEKAVKAVFLANDAAFPYTHDLARLLTNLVQVGEEIPPDIRRATSLTRFAVFTRYPGMADPVTAEEHAEAVTIAEAVLAWAERRIQQT
ncbi:MAG: HEPN domain-containing protein [Thermomicrobiales bacterium]